MQPRHECHTSILDVRIRQHQTGRVNAWYGMPTDKKQNGELLWFSFASDCLQYTQYVTNVFHIYTHVESNKINE